MPIADVMIVSATAADGSPAWAQAVADAIGSALHAAPGRVWVRLQWLPASLYAENGPPPGVTELPVFVTLLHASPPSGAALAAEVQAVTGAIAAAVGRPAERVHIEYAPPGAGRVAFGGTLVG